MQRTWVNHATRFNWALTRLAPDTGWVPRLDTDEYLTPGLAAGIKAVLPGLQIGTIAVDVTLWIDSWRIEGD